MRVFQWNAMVNLFYAVVIVVNIEAELIKELGSKNYIAPAILFKKTCNMRIYRDVFIELREPNLIKHETFVDIVFPPKVWKFRVATFGMYWQFSGNSDLCINVLVDPESKKTLMSLVEVLVLMVLHVAMEHDKWFDFVCG